VTSQALTEDRRVEVLAGSPAEGVSQTGELEAVLGVEAAHDRLSGQSDAGGGELDDVGRDGAGPSRGAVGDGFDTARDAPDGVDDELVLAVEGETLRGGHEADGPQRPRSAIRLASRRGGGCEIARARRMRRAGGC